MKKEKVYLFLIFVILTIIITFPAIFFIKDKMIGDMGDGYQFVSFQYLANKLFTAGHFPFGYTNFWRYPYGIDFQNIYDSSLLIIFGLILYQFFSNPILVYNISVFGFIFLNLYLSYYSFRSLFPLLISLTGAVIYGLSFYSIGKLGGHINLFLISAFPFLFISIYRIYREKGSIKSFILFSTASILLPFTSLQYALILLGSSPFLAVTIFIFYKKELERFVKILWRKKWIFLISLIVIVTVFSIFHGHKILTLIRNQIFLPKRYCPIPSMNYFIPNGYLKTISAFFVNNSERSIENSVFFGYVEIILFGIALIKLKKNRLFWSLLLLFTVFFIISLGLPFYQYLFNNFPYNGIMESDRFIVIGLIFFVLIILLWLKNIKNDKSIVFILILLIFERIPFNIYLSPNLYEKNFIQALKTTKSKAVLYLPMRDWWEQFYNMYSIYSDKPMVNGYIQWSGDNNYSRTFMNEFSEYICYPGSKRSNILFDMQYAIKKRDALINFLMNYDIRTIVVSNSQYESGCSNVKKNIDAIFEDKEKWKVIFNDGEKEIFVLK